MSSLVIELPYPTSTGNHAVRHGAGGHYLTKGALAYRMAVAQALAGRRAPAGAIRTDWLLAPPTAAARDFDNLMKVVADALTQAGFWVDDSNRILVRGSWEWTAPVQGGRVWLEVSPLK